MSQKQKRPSFWHPIERAKYDGSLRTYGEIQARILPTEMADEFDTDVPPQWKEQPALYLLRGLGMEKGLPPGTGFGLVQSPYADIYTKIYGVNPIADLPLYRKIYRTQPDVQQAIQMQVNLAIGKGFTIGHKSDEVTKYLEQMVNKLDLMPHMLSMASDALIYGNAYTEIQWDKMDTEKEQMYEYSGNIYTKNDLAELDIPLKKAKYASLTGSDGNRYNFISEKTVKAKDAKTIVALKDLDPLYMRVRRDSYGNQYGLIQWLAFPPVLIDNASCIHVKYRPMSWGYESAYGTSILMPIIKNSDLLNQFENDSAVWIHSRAVPPLIVKGGTPEKPYSVLPDERILAFNDNDLHLDTFENFAKYEGVTDEKNVIHPEKDIFVPSFNNKNEIVLKKVYGIVKHKYTGDIYKIKTRYGKEIKITSGHSLFKWETKNENYPFMKGYKGKIVSCPSNDMKIGDYIAISSKLPVIEKDRTTVNILDLFEDKWKLLVNFTDEEWIKYNLAQIFSIPLGFNQFSEIADKKLEVYFEIKNLIKSKYPDTTIRKSKRFINRIKKSHKMPYPVYEILQKQLNIPIGGITTVNKRPDKSEELPLKIEITNDLLWTLGMYIAEGCNKPFSISFASDDYNIDKLSEILTNIGFHNRKDSYYKVPGRTGKFSSCPPTVCTYSLIFRKIIEYLGVKDKRVPAWILQLPLTRSKWFLKGLYDGDGNHSSKNTTAFGYTTKSKDLSEDIIYLLLRFNVISGVKHTRTPFNTNVFYIYGTVNNLDFENWDKIKVQTNIKGNAYHLENEIALVKIREIEKYPVVDQWVYDFQVEETENFISSFGIMSHNTTEQMQSLMSTLKHRTAATMIFTKGDVTFDEFTTIASDLKLDWWLNYLLLRRYQSLGVPPMLMGKADRGSSGMAEVILHDFVSRLQVLQEFIADPIEEYIFRPLITAKFGTNEDNAEIIWKPIIEEDKNMRSQRLIQMLQAGAATVNEVRVEMGFKKINKTKYNELQEPAEPGGFSNGFPPKPGAGPAVPAKPGEAPAIQKKPPVLNRNSTPPESHMKMEEDLKTKKIDLLKLDDAFRTKMLELTETTKFKLRDDSQLVKDVKQESFSSAKEIINEHVVASYLIGRMKANASVGKEDDLILKQEDLKKLTKLKESCLRDFEKIVLDMVDFKEKGLLE